MNIPLRSIGQYSLQTRSLSYIQQKVQLFPYHVYLNSEHLIGDVMICIDQGNRLSLQWFQIKPDYRGYGHGRRLYEVVEDHIKNDLKHNNIYLSSVQSAYRFWLRLGYQKIENSMNDDVIPMMKRLP